MRAAPAADALLSGGRALRWLIVALHLGAMVASLAWVAGWMLPASAWASPRALPAAAWLVIAVGLLLAVALGHWQAARLLPVRCQRLRWDGQGWHLLTDGKALALARVSVQIDLGRHLLLRLHAPDLPGGVLWAVATARAAGADWHGLRVALHYHAGALVALTAPGDETMPGR